jgi:hypothetical protein
MSPTIQAQADQVRAASTGRLPAEVLEAFDRDRERMIGRGTPADARGSLQACPSVIVSV